MAKFNLISENRTCCLSHCTASRKASIFSNYSRQNFVRVPPSRQSLHFRVSCSIKEKEKENAPEVFDEVRVNGEPGKKGSLISASGDDLGDEIGDGKVGFDWNWPPWKNLPQRYKLIGTTSLAFVICNMDKCLGV